MAAELKQFLGGLGLEQYLPEYLRAGYQNWESLISITEAELATINARRGDRRKLQRAVARRKNWPDHKPLPTSLELRQHVQSLRRYALGLSSEWLEENCYSLVSPPQSLSSSVDNDSRSLSAVYTPADIRRQVAELLQASNDWYGAGATSESVQYSDVEKDSYSLRSFELERMKTYLSWSVPEDVVDDEDTKEVDHGGLASNNYVIEHSSSLPKGGRPSPSSAQANSSTVNLQGGYPLSPLTSISTSTDSTGDRMSVGDSDKAFNSASIVPFLEAFCQNVNHVFFLFSESELPHLFPPGGQAPLNAYQEIELYLILALGAKYSDVQAEGLQNGWYATARVHLLGREFDDDLWMMRVLTLICLFEINDIEVSSNFLDTALDLGQAIGFDAEQAPSKGVGEADHYQWLRVWDTMRILRSWILLRRPDLSWTLSDPAYFLDTDQPPLISEESYNSRLVQMSMSAIGTLLREVVSDRHVPAKTSSPLLYKTHLRALDNWYLELPLYLCLRTPTSDNHRMVHPEADNRQKAGILNVHCFFLGVVCELLLPTVTNASKHLPMDGESEYDLYYRRCIHSAKLLIHLCHEIVQSGFPLAASFIAQHSLEENNVQQERLNCIKIADKLLNHEAVTKGVASNAHAIIIRLCAVEILREKNLA